MEIVELYKGLSGRDVIEPVYYYVYGLFKIAVIVQQIYFRYRMGKTRDPRFSNLIAVVRAAGSMATRAIERDRIDDLG
jgi:aminoglycoside phosphotransferase (APT) family kinase protein